MPPMPGAQPRRMKPLSTAAFHPGRGSLGRWAAGRAGKVPLGHVCSFMAPKGTFLIISPRNLINLHSVMNLEISIKNIITNQDRIQNSRGLSVAAQRQEAEVGVLPSLHFGHPRASALALANPRRHGRCSWNSPLYGKPRGSRINPQRGSHPENQQNKHQRRPAITMWGRELCVSSAHQPGSLGTGGWQHITGAPGMSG